ncbi:MFS transporter [Nonomuraea typhae]|uniref:MFS transporter n=1 Tax=Nonomuraea typhae TaxID=2603600 RepID=UPI001FE7563C|nr:MFS transporter [Nonomuraea typhae]
MSARGLFAIVGLAGFVTTLDNTVVTVALPTIRRELGVRLAALEWVATGYVITFAGLMLAGGRLADVWGHRRVLAGGMAVFGAASLVAGLATSVQVLVAARVVQGAGAALVLPATLAVLAGAGERRPAGVAVWMASGAAALALGPVVGGWLSQHAHWGWVFLLNVPLAALVIGLALVTLPPVARARARLDVPGIVTSVVFLASGTFVLIHGAEHGWARPEVLLGAVVSLVALLGFLSVERRGAEPMADLTLFRARSFTGGVLAQVTWGLGANGVFFYTAIFLQDVLGFTPAASGAAFVPLAVLVVAVTPAVPYLERRYGAGRTVAAGLVLVAGGMVVAALLRPGDGWAELLPAVCAIGVGSALTTPLGSAVLGAVPESRAGVAGGVFSVSREVSGLFGIAGIGGIVHAAGTFAAGYTAGLLAAAVLVLSGALVSVVSVS